ncbi:MAG TPA: hypothetical protein VGI39_23855, partial [Polyangiaceae bacterium]
VETLSRIRTLPRAGRARVVVISGHAGQLERWRLRLLGVRDFVEKPIDLPALLGKVSAIAMDVGWAKAG